MSLAAKKEKYRDISENINIKRSSHALKMLVTHLEL